MNSLPFLQFTSILGAFLNGAAPASLSPGPWAAEQISSREADIGVRFSVDSVVCEGPQEMQGPDLERSLLRIRNR